MWVERSAGKIEFRSLVCFYLFVYGTLVKDILLWLICSPFFFFLLPSALPFLYFFNLLFLFYFSFSCNFILYNLFFVFLICFLYIHLIILHLFSFLSCNNFVSIFFYIFLFFVMLNSSIFNLFIFPLFGDTI